MNEGHHCKPGSRTWVHERGSSLHTLKQGTDTGCVYDTIQAKDKTQTDDRDASDAAVTLVLQATVYEQIRHGYQNACENSC